MAGKSCRRTLAITAVTGARNGIGNPKRPHMTIRDARNMRLTPCKNGGAHNPNASGLPNANPGTRAAPCCIANLMNPDRELNKLRTQATTPQNKHL